MQEPSARQRQAGFTLLEMLISLSLTLVTLAVLYTSLIAFRRLHFDHTERTRIEQEMRASYEFMTRDLDSAGYHMIARGKLGYFGTIFPNGDASDTVTTNTLSIWRNPGVAEGVVTETMAAVDSPVRVDSVAGFTVGMRIWVIGYCTDGLVHRDALLVTKVNTAAPLSLEHATPTNPSANLSCRYKSGARAVRLEQITYGIQASTAGGFDLTRKVNEEAAAAVASGLSELTFSYFNGKTPIAQITPNSPLTRRDLRRLRIDLTGTATVTLRGTGLAPTVRFRGDIAPRNLVLQENL